MENRKITARTLLEMKRQQEKIAALTAYDYTFAQLLDQAGMDIILIGDSAAMVIGGYSNTLPLTMEQALYHCQAVRKGVKNAMVVADMPFLSYHVSLDKAVENAGRFFKEANVDAVKIEGGEAFLQVAKRFVDCGMPVMGHIGLMPQSVKKLGGYLVQGTTEASAEKLFQDAIALETAGAFAIVLEKIPAEVAKKITKRVSIPTIGIGAGPHCDGQILVTFDLLGLYEEFRPKFVRRYAELGEVARKAFTDYIRDVKNSNFPNESESY